jgi:hypothetical protein
MNYFFIFLFGRNGMPKVLLGGLLWLPAAVANACAVCRPRVQAGIHNAAYSANLLLVLLPVAVLLLGGLGLFFAADIRHRFLARPA